MCLEAELDVRSNGGHLTNVIKIKPNLYVLALTDAGIQYRDGECSSSVKVLAWEDPGGT